MKLSHTLALSAALWAVPAAAEAQLPTCANVIQFGVDCQIGNTQTGGIVLSGFSQFFGAVSSGVTYRPGGTIGVQHIETSSSTSRVRLLFDAQQNSAVLVYASRSQVSGEENIRMNVAGLGGSTITSATLGTGNASGNSQGCSYDLFGTLRCGWATTSVNQRINGNLVGNLPTNLNASSIDITRQSVATASSGGYHATSVYSYSCGSFWSSRTCTGYNYNWLGSGTATTPDQWVYEFDVKGTGLTSAVDVPEPQTLALLAVGLLGLTAAKSRRRS